MTLHLSLTYRQSEIMYHRNQMEDVKYHTVGTVLKWNIKVIKDTKLIPIAHKCMTVHFPGSNSAKVAGLN